MSRSFRKPYSKETWPSSETVSIAQRALRRKVKQLLSYKELSLEDLLLPTLKSFVPTRRRNWTETPALNQCEVEYHEDRMVRHRRFFETRRRCKTNPLIPAPRWFSCSCYGNPDSYYRRLERK